MSANGQQPAALDLGDLRFDEGGHLLVKRALRAVPHGERHGGRA